MADIAELGLKVDTKGLKDAKPALEAIAASSQKVEGAIDKLGGALTDAARSAGVYVDKAGKLREANGRFVSSARQAELGLQGFSDAAKEAAEGLGEASGAAGRFSFNAENAGKAIGAAIAALSVGAIVNWTKETTRAIAELDRFARLSNTTAEEFQKVAYASARFGVEQEKLADILKDTNDKFGDFFQTGAGPLVDFFEQVAPRVGITADAFRGLSGPDALGLYVKTLEEAGVNQQDMTFYLEALASDATLLQGVFEDGSAALAMYSAEAERLGLVLSGSTIAQAREFQNQLTTLDAILTNTSQNVAAEMLPALNDMMGLLIELNAESDAMATVGETLGVVFKGLASAAVVVGAAFKVAGDNIGAVAASAAAAVDGDFSGALEILKNRPGEALETLEAAFTRIDRLWDGSAAKTAEAAGKMERSVRQWERIDTPAKEKAAKATVALTDAQKEAQLSAEALAKAEQSNADVIASLTEQIYQAGLSADELAKRQAVLRLNEYATPEQIAAVRQLAGELQRLDDAGKSGDKQKQNQQLLGQLDPMAGEKQRFATELENLRLLNEAKLLEDQRYLDLKGQAERDHAEQVRILQEENFRAQSVGNELIMASLDQLQQAGTNALTGLITGASNGEEAIRALAGAILNEAVGAVVQMGIQYVKTAVMGQAAAAAGAATALSTGLTTAAALSAAYSTPAALVSLATFGANAPAASAGIASTIATSKALSLTSFDGGGYTGNGSRSGGLDGKGGFLAMMHPQETVIDHTKGQSMGGTVINIVESKDRAGTQQQRQGADGREEVDVFVADIMGDGKRARALQTAFGLQRRGV